MAKTKMALLKLLRKAGMQGDIDFLREGVRMLAQALVDLEAVQEVGAERHERTPERRNYRNGYRLRRWDTRVGTIYVRIPGAGGGGNGLTKALAGAKAWLEAAE